MKINFTVTTQSKLSLKAHQLINADGTGYLLQTNIFWNIFCHDLSHTTGTNNNKLYVNRKEIYSVRSLCKKNHYIPKIIFWESFGKIVQF